MPKHAVEVVDWTSWNKLRVRKLRLVFHDAALHERDGGRWAQLQSMVVDGQLIHGSGGPIHNVPISDSVIERRHCLLSSLLVGPGGCQQS